jgi:hypothetical protein
VSKTKFVEYGDLNRPLGDLPHGFWVYDVGLDIFLKYLIDAAQASEQANTAWLSSAISEWRLACIPDYGLTLDASWSSEQRQTFCVLAEDACARLEARESIPAEEIVSWPILDDLRIFTRGADEVFTAPIVELGRAIIALVSGQLPEAPEGQIWLYGAPEGRMTIGWNKPAAQPPIFAPASGSDNRKFRGIFSSLSTVGKLLSRFRR